jgi:hypothetical protein
MNKKLYIFNVNLNYINMSLINKSITILFIFLFVSCKDKTQKNISIDDLYYLLNAEKSDNDDYNDKLISLNFNSYNDDLTNEFKSSGAFLYSRYNQLDTTKIEYIILKWNFLDQDWMIEYIPKSKHGLDKKVLDDLLKEIIKKGGKVSSQPSRLKTIIFKKSRITINDGLEMRTLKTLTDN